MSLLIILLITIDAHSATGRAAQTRPTTQAATRPANLVSNGDFELPDETGNLPKGWTTKHPQNVRLIKHKGRRGRVIEMTGEAKLMGSYGTDLLSEKIAFEPDTCYRCTGYIKSTGPKMIVFVKGYATVKRKIEGQVKTFEDAVYQMRREIEPSTNWRQFNLDFDILPANVFSDFQHKVEYLRITLWAYWPAGTCWYDDIRFEKVGPIRPDQRRHDQPVTHVGLKPRLGDQATKDGKDEKKFDEEQTWRDAFNAWGNEQYEKSLQFTERLIAHAPHKGAYRLLAARVLVKLQRWSEADEHALWVLNETFDQADDPKPKREIESWQRDWAQVVHGEVLLRTHRTEQGREILEKVIKNATSPHARQAAEKLLGEP